MDSNRIISLYHQPGLINSEDVNGLKMMIQESPYYYLPYVILAKFYVNENEQEFDFYLRHAAIRVNNREALYHYIHQSESVKRVDNIEVVPATNTIDNSVILTTQESEIIEDKQIVEEEIPTEELAQVDEIQSPINYLEAFLKDDEEALPNESIDNVIEVNQNESINEDEEIVFELRHNNELTVTDELLLQETENLELVETEFTFSTQHQQIEENIEVIPSDNETELETKEEPKEESQETHSVEQNEVPTMAEELVEVLIDENTDPSKTEEIVVEELIEIAENQIEETEEEIQETEKESLQLDSQTEELHKTPNDSQKELEQYLNLRKNPIYNLEVELNSKQKERETATSEKDFFAWLKQPKVAAEMAEKSNEDELITVDNIEEEVEEDDIIARFIKKNPQISRPKKEFYNAENMAKKSEVFELDFVTETLAQLYHQQGDISLAIKAYEKLILQNPSKKAYFASLIENLKKEKK
jgi:hypothetical protein